MRRVVALSLVSAVLIAACKSSTSPTNSVAYTCSTLSYPTTAPASITVSGVVQGFTSSPIDSAVVLAFKNGTATPVDSTMTNASGQFTLNASTGGAPLDGYVKASKSGLIDTYAFPSAPLPANASITLTMINTTTLGLLASNDGVTPVAGKGALAIRPVDCTETVVPTATVSTSPSATLYGDASGDFFAFNVAPGSVQVNAQYQSHVFHSHSVTAIADAVTITIIAPGPVTPPE